MTLLNGVEVTRQIRQRSRGTEVIIFTMHDKQPDSRLLRAGALGYLLKSDARQLLLTAVDTVAAHKPFFTGMVAETLRQSFLTKGHVDSLSPRERSVVQLIAEGHNNKRVARILDLGVKTVETHRAAAHRKLGFSSTANFVRYALRNRMVEA